MTPIQSLAYLTEDLPGIGGQIKQRPEDFIVDEQHLDEPSGAGEHLLLCVEKRGQTTTDMVRRVAKMFRVRRSDVGYAGLKDKRAVTRQHLTVHLPDHSNDEKFLSRFEFTPFKLIWSQRHSHKLRRGHLSGNRFVIYIREVEPTSVVMAKTVLDRLTSSGSPNYVGRQRFGYRQTNHELGRLLLLERWGEMLDIMLGRPVVEDGPATRSGREFYERGDYLAALEAWTKSLRHDRQALDALRQGRSPHDAVMAIEGQQREYLISALQSAMFNWVLDKRIHDGLLGCLVEGDLAWKHDNRSVFAVDQKTADLENGPNGRVGRLQVSPSGPMWGAKISKPFGRVLEWEMNVLSEQELTEGILSSVHHVSMLGSRRSLRVKLRDPDIRGGADKHGPYVRVTFELPRGSFATTVLREIMKNDREV